MQFGIEIPGYFKWSLANMFIRNGLGLYENLGRCMYVNRVLDFMLIQEYRDHATKFWSSRLKKREEVA
jgi:hypothetical protein